MSVDFTRAKRHHSLLDMSPLIDCVFQLLIFFMLTSTFATPKIKLDLPEASTGATTNEHALTISAAPGGRILVDDTPVPLDELEATLTDRIARTPDKTVTFQGDRAIPYDTFVTVVDVARKAGATGVRIAHDPQGAPAP